MLCNSITIINSCLTIYDIITIIIYSYYFNNLIENISILKY